MNIAEYIESGILELYASGAVSPAEKQEVEQAAAQYPQIREALDQALAAFEDYATLHAVEPDEKLRDQILNAAFNKNAKAESPKLIPLNADSSSRWKNLAIAASVVLLLSIGFNLYQAYELKSSKELAERMATEQSARLAATEGILKQTKNELSDFEKTLAFLRTPENQTVTLNTTDNAHPMKAMIHWDMNSKMVAVDPMTLPQTNPEQMYVLWAVIDGVAVNKGAFTVSDSTGIVMLQTVPKAEAFAISLETKPDVPQHEGPIYVLGKTSPALP